MTFITTLLLGLFFFLISASQVHAVCPLCTIAVGAGLGVSRWIGIDDTVTGIWIGGIIVSSGLWLADWLGKKKWRIPYKKTLSTILFFLFVIPPLYWGNMIGLPGNMLWGTDKILLGTFFGSMVFMLAVWLDQYLRTTNKDRVYLYYQKVIIPV
ncbi:MAG: hypothetical protein NUV52_03060, partial [Candidatus Roizmanbacteria bacterium]|nr:hypothetical protein [Candidatus Roizmanbacteria bacterium]